VARVPRPFQTCFARSCRTLRQSPAPLTLYPLTPRATRPLTVSLPLALSSVATVEAFQGDEQTVEVGRANHRAAISPAQLQASGKPVIRASRKQLTTDAALQHPDSCACSRSAEMAEFC